MNLQLRVNRSVAALKFGILPSNPIILKRPMKFMRVMTVMLAMAMAISLIKTSLLAKMMVTLYLIIKVFFRKQHPFVLAR